MRRVGMVMVAALVLVVLSSCTPAAEVPEPSTTPSSSTSAPTRPATPPRPDTVDTRGAGSNGMNIRYLGEDGKTRTLDVKDFGR